MEVIKPDPLPQGFESFDRLLIELKWFSIELSFTWPYLHDMDVVYTIIYMGQHRVKSTFIVHVQILGSQIFLH